MSYHLFYKTAVLGLSLGLPLPAFAQDVAASKLLAEQGNAQAQYEMGEYYFNGYDVPQNYAIADTWYQKSAAQGNADAQTAIGLAYYNGDGVRRDYK